MDLLIRNIDIERVADGNKLYTAIIDSNRSGVDLLIGKDGIHYKVYKTVILPEDVELVNRNDLMGMFESDDDEWFDDFSIPVPTIRSVISAVPGIGEEEDD